MDHFSYIYKQNSDVDSRKKMLEFIEQRAKSYTPEWVPDFKEPDVGSTLAMLYADGAEKVIDSMKESLELEYVSLINMLGISLKKAYPATGVVLMNVDNDNAPGRRFPAGIRLMTDTESTSEEDEGETPALIFESVNPIYATASKLTHIFKTDVGSGTVKCVVPGDEVISDEELSHHSFIIAHETLFNTKSSRVFVNFDAGAELISLIRSGFITISYIVAEDEDDEGRLVEIDDIKIEERGFSFRPEGRIGTMQFGSRTLGCLIFTAKGPVKNDITVENIGITSSSEEPREPIIYDGSKNLNARAFLPFSDRISLYSECIIGDNDYLNKPGAMVKLDFDLSFNEGVNELPKQVEAVNLRIVKMKPKKSVELSPAKVFVQEVAIEYFNGRGWNMLPVDRGFSTIFGADDGGHVTMQFVCPDDMSPTEVGARDCFAIRFRLTRADNCYYIPSIHHYPVIRNMTLSYSYGGSNVLPDLIQLYNYNDLKTLKKSDYAQDNIKLLNVLPAPESAIYMGFSKAFEDGPINLLVEVDEGKISYISKLELEYYNGEGFVRHKFVDNTMGLAHTGTFSFMPPSDMARVKLFGVERYWLKLYSKNSKTDEALPTAPEFDRIAVNAIEVKNIHTYPEDDYFTDDIKANMSFPLSGTNILDADVWVNETGQFTDAQMRNMLIQTKNDARAEYDFRGNISRFFVRWTEVDNFDLSKPGDRHYSIDRMNNRIHFGDGVNVAIPRVTNDVSFRVVLRSCDGEIANIGPDKITSSFNNLVFIDNITNPSRTYGGMNMERLDQALIRGTGIINSRNRLISLRDYERETTAFSSRIVSCKAVSGVRRDGSIDPGYLGVAVLVDDFEKSDATFVSIRERLLPHLLQKSELSVTDANLDVVEPILVSVNVQVWASATEAGDTFEITSELTKVLDDFLSPTKNRSLRVGSGLEKSRIELRLHMEKAKAWIRRVLATAVYADEDGVHECDLESLPDNPYFLIRGGEHTIRFVEE